MNRICLALLALLLLTRGAHAAPTPSPVPRSSPSGASARPPASAALRALAAEYRALRLVKGRFGGGAWNASVDAWGARKHVLMQTLGATLGNGAWSEKQVAALMGPPDDVLTTDSPVFLHEKARSGRTWRGASRLLVYAWRGRRDFLYFVCAAGRVIDADWFLSLE